MRPWSAHVLALALASGAVGHALWSAAREGWTYDEAFHLTWSERFLDTGVSERTSQERLNSKTPIMVPAVLARKAARAAGMTDAGALRFFARAPSALWLALLLLLVYAAGRELQHVDVEGVETAAGRNGTRERAGARAARSVAARQEGTELIR